MFTSLRRGGLFLRPCIAVMAIVALVCVRANAGEMQERAKRVALSWTPEFVSPLVFADSLDKFEEREFFETVYTNLSYLFRGNMGHQENLCVLAFMYHHGLGVGADREKAILYYKYATLPQHSHYFYADYVAFDGLRELTGSPDHDIKELAGRKLPDIAAEAEGLTPEAMYRKAQMHFYGVCARFDNELGQAWLVRAADNGHAVAKLEAAANYITGRRVVMQNLDAARALLLSLGDDARALALLGDIHNQIFSAAPDIAKAREYYEKALANSEAPYADALLDKLITAYEKDGDGKTKHATRLGELRALKERQETERGERIKARKSQGDDPAMERHKEIARLFEEGTADGYYRAAMLIKSANQMAAALEIEGTDAGGVQGDHTSLRFVGTFANARLWEPVAVFRLGWIQEFGLCGEPNYYGAGVAYRNAAERGHAEAMLRLGMLHEEGKGVRRSLTQARRWYALAADAGDQEAAKRLAALPDSVPDGAEEWDTPEFRKVLITVRGLQYMEYYKERYLEDLKAKVAWLLEAAEHDNPFAQGLAAGIYMDREETLGIARDPAKAEALGRRAEESIKWFDDAVRRMKRGAGR